MIRTIFPREDGDRSDTDHLRRISRVWQTAKNNNRHVFFNCSNSNSPLKFESTRKLADSKEFFNGKKKKYSYQIISNVKSVIFIWKNATIVAFVPKNNSVYTRTVASLS